jgi:tetratricopeptide (TPR) repeat protein
MWFVLGRPEWRTAGLYGVYVAMAYFVIVQITFARHHRVGILRVKQGRWDAAIHCFNKSYEVFSRHAWLDRYRPITLMSASDNSYRAMALLNVAYANARLGNEAQAERYYRRVLDEFPGNRMARAGLKWLASTQSSTGEPGDTAQSAG